MLLNPYHFVWRELGVAATASRVGAAFDLSGKPLTDGVGIADYLQYSPTIFDETQILPTPFTGNEVVWGYADTVANTKALAAAHPGSIVYENLCGLFSPLPSGREMSALRILDDGTRPIWFIQTGTHGDEVDAVRGTYNWIQRLLTSSAPIYKWARDNISIHWLVVSNPDGRFHNKRRNGDDPSSAVGVNLNRNWDWFFDATPDTDKGVTAFDQIETANFRDWMLTGTRLARGKLIVDFHQWSSQTTYGYLHDNSLWKGEEGAHLRRACYHYIFSAMKGRNWATLNPVNGTSNMRPVEYKSARKPYPIYWALARMAPGAYGFLWESPNTENQAINGTVTMDVLDGTLRAMRDSVSTALKPCFYAAPEVLPTEIINNNSLLTEWDATNARPTWTRISGLTAATATDADGAYVELTRPLLSGFPTTFTVAASVSHIAATAHESFILIAGGKRTSSKAVSENVTIEYFAAPPPTSAGNPIPVITAKNIAPLPSVLQEFALANDGTYIYAVCGHTGTAYSASIYRIPIATIETSPWTLWATLSKGIQRHTAEIWNGKLLIIGGRDSTAYLNTIIAVDLATTTESVLGTFSTARGWHKTIVDADKLYIVGGWTGSAALTSTRVIDLPTMADTALASLPFTRREGSLVLRKDDNNVKRLWWLAGRETDGTFSETIYYYDITANTWTGLLTGSGYTRVDEVGDDDGVLLSPEPFKRINGVAAYNPYSDKIHFWGGEDTTTTLRDTVFNFDPDLREMDVRVANDSSWGYLRASQTHTAQLGESYTLESVVQNAELPPSNKTTYIRPTIYVGPLGSPRTFRFAYTIPPANKAMTMSMPIQVLPANYNSAQELRAYYRHYTAGSRSKLRAMQLLRKPFCGVVSPLTGKAPDVVSATFAAELVADKKRIVRGAFTPRWGSQVNCTVDVLTFSTGGSLTNCRLRWVGSSSTVGDAFPDSTTAGKFELVYTIGGVETVVVMANDWEVNHDRFAPHPKRDTVHFELRGVPTGIQLKLVFYGISASAVIPSGTISGCSSNGAGVSLYISH